MTILTTADAASRFVVAPHMQRVIALGGPGGWRQVLQMWRGRRGTGRFSPKEYYDYALWRPEVTAARRQEFVFATQNRPANDSLRQSGVPASDAIIEDKLASAALFAAHGLPSTTTRAFYAADPGIVPAQDVPTLRDRAALAALLADPAQYPLFGKPLSASRSRGVVNLAGLGPEPGQVTLSNGVAVPLAMLLDEIVQSWGGGYLLQEQLTNHAALLAHLGTAAGSLRLVTLMRRDGPALLYAKLKLPAAMAMHDGPSKGPRAGAMIDPATGQIGAIRIRFDLAAPRLTHWRDPDHALSGLVLPHFPAAVAAVFAGHRLFPAHGVLGWDVVLTDRGPVLNEVNANPDHNACQQVTGRGLMNADLLPLWRQAQDWALG